MEEPRPAATDTHNDVHSSRLFQCRVCAHTFMKNEHLIRHIRIHTKEKPFRCPHCGKSYSRRDTLIRHRRQVQCIPKGITSNVTVTHGQLLPGELEVDQGDSCSLVSWPEETWWADDSGRAEEVASLSMIPPPSSTNFSCGSDQPARSTRSAEPARASTILGSTGLPGSERWPLIYETPFEPESYEEPREYFPPWDSAPHLLQNIPQIDRSPLEIVGDAEPGPGSVSIADMQLADLKQIQDLWHGQIPETPESDIYHPGQTIEPIYGHLTPPCSSPTNSSEVDDLYREGLQNWFRISIYEPAIPSIDFLNACVRLYFARVHPLFPILHPPTFRPCKANAGLLLSICAMGCLFTGSDRGLQHGVYLFERTHKTTLLNWERQTARNQGVMIPLIQSALIAQLFGLLSGSQVLLLTADAFHGPPVAWARQLRLHQSQDPLLIDLGLQGSQLDELWRKWAHHEELLRIAHGLFIIDAELSSLLHREPLQRFESYKFSPTASEVIFMAGSAQEWKLCMLSSMQCQENRPLLPKRTDEVSNECFSLNTVPESSLFTATAVLQGIGMLALFERTKTTADSATLQTVSKSLAVFHHRFLSGETGSEHKSLYLSVLWHAVQMSTLANFDFLEKVVGREGRHPSQAEEEALKEWIEKEESRVCLKHALMIQRQMESYQLTSEPAMHVPRALFWAGLVVFCHIRSGTYDQPGLQARPRSSNIQASDVWKCQTLGLSEIEKTVVDSSSLKMTLLMLADMLRTIGHWGLARRFSKILITLNGIKF